MSKELKQKAETECMLVLKGRKDTYYSKIVRISMDTIDSKPNFAVFNTDRKYYTRSFINPSCKMHEDEQINLYQKKLQRCEEISEIYVPRPKKEYCSVCREDYQDYLIHTCSQSHRSKSQKSKYQRYIDSLANKFRLT